MFLLFFLFAFFRLLFVVVVVVVDISMNFRQMSVINELKEAFSSVNSVKLLVYC